MAWWALLHIAARSAVWHFSNIPWSRTRLSQRVMYHWTSSVGSSISNERNISTTRLGLSVNKICREACLKQDSNLNAWNPIIIYYISKARTTGVYCSICLLSMLYHTASSLRSHLLSWTLLKLSHHVEIDTWIWNRRGSEEGTSIPSEDVFSQSQRTRSNHHL